jgi:uncharacterized protein YifN (PemK superfamily)
VPLQIALRPGTVLVCDYEFGRSSVLPGEMTKRRPVVVIAPRRRHGTGPIIVVPLSTSPPERHDDRHVRIEAGTYDFLRPDVDSWVKCEFIRSVSTHRLYRSRRGAANQVPRLSDADLASVIRATIQALGGRDLLFQQ